MYKRQEKGGEILFFVFTDPGKMHIYLDCPSISRGKYFMEFESLKYVETVHIYENSKFFRSLEVAMETFKCRTKISVLPGTILHFYSNLRGSGGNMILISFVYQSLLFSISIQKDEIVVSSQSQIPHIKLKPPMEALGIIH